MEIKVCSKCGKEKPLTEFYKSGFNSKGEQIYRSDCKECQSKYDSSRRKEIKELIQNNKKACAKCGDTRAYVLDYHHKDPKEKKFTIGMTKNNSLKANQNEIAKCIVLCANCHREFHWLEKQGLTLDEYLQ